MKTKRVFLAVTLLIAGVGCMYLFPRPTPLCHEALPVRFSLGNIPCIDIVIEEKPYTVGIDLGSRFPLALQGEVLENLEKSPAGVNKYRNFHGEWFESFKYRLPKVGLKTIEYLNIEAHAVNEAFHRSAVIRGGGSSPLSWTRSGQVGVGFFLKTNFLLDVRHRVAFASNDLNQLVKDGYPVRQWHAVPFKRSKYGLVLDVYTDLGWKKFALDTGFTITTLRSIEAQNLPYREELGLKVCRSKQFKIGGRDVGDQELYLLDLSPKGKWNGILGMDFLDKQPFYVDFEKSVVYFDFDHRDVVRTLYHSSLPISFTPEKKPHLSFPMEGVLCHVGLNCRQKNPLVLTQEQFEKVPIHPGSSEAPPYHQAICAKITFIFRDTIATHESLESPLHGNIGWSILSSLCLLIDYPHRRGYFSNNLYALAKAGFPVEMWSKACTKTTQSGVSVKVKTSLGKKRFLIDLSASKTAIVAQGKGSILSATFNIGGREFGPMEMSRIADVENGDGILGMDFLSCQPFYLDMIRDTVYFGERHHSAEMSTPAKE